MDWDWHKCTLPLLYVLAGTQEMLAHHGDIKDIFVGILKKRILSLWYSLLLLLWNTFQQRVLQKGMLPNDCLVLPMTFIREKSRNNKWHWLLYPMCPFGLHICLCLTSRRKVVSDKYTAYRLTSESLVFTNSHPSIPLWSRLSWPVTHIYILILSFAHILGLLKVGST